MNHLINMMGVTKHYKDFTLDSMNLTVDPGEVVGLIGRNGAGKTTLIKSLLGIVRTSDGTIELLGRYGPARNRRTRAHGRRLRRLSLRRRDVRVRRGLSRKGHLHDLGRNQVR